MSLLLVAGLVFLAGVLLIAQRVCFKRREAGLRADLVRHLANRDVSPFTQEREIAGVAQEKRHLALVYAEARKHAPDVACVNCRHWDLEGGQKAIAQNPVFATVTQHTTPNLHMQQFDSDGQPIPSTVLADELNRWDMFGACRQKSTVLHAAEKCELFSGRGGPL